MDSQHSQLQIIQKTRTFAVEISAAARGSESQNIGGVVSGHKVSPRSYVNIRIFNLSNHISSVRCSSFGDTESSIGLNATKSKL